MGRLSARLAIKEAIELAGIDYVGTVFAARPTEVQEDDYDNAAYGVAMSNMSPNGSNCVIIVNLPGLDKRMQRGLVGRGNVNDTWIMPVKLELFFASTGGDAEAAQLDYDTVIDALTILVRNDPTMSAPEAVWSAGEFTAGVTHTQSAPITTDDGLTVLITGWVGFECWQWAAGAGV